MAIISLEGGTPDTQATVGRLLKNQTDIGNAIKPFYGKAAGVAVTKLLREHILIAADVIAAAKAGNKAELTDAQNRWTSNADQIAAAAARGQPAPLEARSDEGGDASAPRADDERGSGQAPGELGCRRRRLRRRPSAHPAHGGHALGRDRQAVPGALPLSGLVSRRGLSGPPPRRSAWRDVCARPGDRGV